jgi:hypothetical protein
LIDESNNNTPTKENISDIGVETKSPFSGQKISPDRYQKRDRMINKYSPNYSPKGNFMSKSRGRILSGKRSLGLKVPHLIESIKTMENNVKMEKEANELKNMIGRPININKDAKLSPEKSQTAGSISFKNLKLEDKDHEILKRENIFQIDNKKKNTQIDM